MGKLTKWLLVGSLLTVALLGGTLLLAHLPRSSAQADDPLARGAYLAVVSGCQSCHSPEDDSDFSGGSYRWDDQTVYAPNLTPSESGLAGWSAEESKTAISRGLAPDGRQLHPSMPYLYYNHLADDDLAALAAYLLSLDPVDTPAQPENDLSGLALPPVPPAQSGIVAPTIDTGEAVYGEYLTEVVLACGACHTPTLETGEPDLARRLAGGVSFSGEWGTIYSGNLTPDMAEGIGPYDDDTVLLAIISGLHPSGRPIYAMPWPSYSQLTGPDAQAVVTYLRTLEPVYSDIPPAQLNPGYEEYSPAQAGTSNLLVTILLGIILVGVIAYLTVRQQRANKRIRETDWEAYFTRVLREAREEEQRSDGKADHQE